MNRHVIHLLSAYVEGQLSPALAHRVRQHTARCPACRAKLAVHERLRTDLKLTLNSSYSPPQTMRNQWWHAIQTIPIRVNRWSLSLALPLLLTLALLLMPVIGAQSMSLPGLSRVQTTQLSPAADALLDPPTTGSSGVDTYVAANATPFPGEAAHLETAPTLARLDLPLIATPPSD